MCWETTEIDPTWWDVIIIKRIPTTSLSLLNLICWSWGTCYWNTKNRTIDVKIGEGATTFKENMVPTWGKAYGCVSQLLGDCFWSQEGDQVSSLHFVPEI